jgi:hypothetical protein
MSMSRGCPNQNPIRVHSRSIRGSLSGLGYLHFGFLSSFAHSSFRPHSRLTPWRLCVSSFPL